MCWAVSIPSLGPLVSGVSLVQSSEPRRRPQLLICNPLVIKNQDWAFPVVMACTYSRLIAYSAPLSNP